MSEKPKTLEDFRTLPAQTWRTLSPQDLGTHVQTYRSTLIRESLKSLPTAIRTQPGQGNTDINKTRISMAVFERINTDTKTYPPLGKDSIAVTKALAKTDVLDKEDKVLCGKIALLCEMRARDVKSKRNTPIQA